MKYVSAIAVSPDGNDMISADRVRVSGLETGKQVREYPGHGTGYGDCVRRTAADHLRQRRPHGPVWETETAKPIQTLTGQGAVCSVACPRTAGPTAGADATVRLEASDGKDGCIPRTPAGDAGGLRRMAVRRQR